ncbi:MAG: HEPN domain-containing protein [Bacteroidales bacterium]|nr:HEPN domain-containing protein [Bacteroidales bacterium]
MKLTDKDRNALVKVRLQNAKEALEEVRGNVGLGYWRVVANRLYYACFYATSALLIKHGITAHTHAGVINQMGLRFISTGIISQEQGKLHKHLFELRQTGDYDDWIHIQKEDVLPLIEPVEQFIATIENLISSL